MLPLVFWLPALGLLAGSVIGRALARRGWRADRSLGGPTSGRIAAGLTLLTAAVVVLNTRGMNIAAALPDAMSLWLQHALPNAARLLLGLALGTLLGLESSAAVNPGRLRRLALPVALIATALAFLVHRGRPIAPTLGAAVLEGSVVMQTTPYTCAPAAIATLLRLTGLAPAADERRMAALAGTSREGTSTFGELRSLRAAGADAEFARGLTADSLRRRAQPALLHVNEPVGATTIRHTIALVGYERATDTFVVANPLEGLQRLRASALEGYWIGEAVFVSGRRWQESPGAP